MPILDINDVKVETKTHELWRKAKEKVNAAANWIKDNPELTALGVAAAGAAAKGLKSLSRMAAVHDDRMHRDRTVYDRSLGMYLHTRRKLNNKDWRMITERRKRGERLADILLDMRLLD